MDKIYNKWLDEGDLKILLLIQRAVKLDELGKQQNYINLMAQIDAILSIPYTGKHRIIWKNNEIKVQSAMHRTALHMYYKVFLYYIENNDFNRAAKTLQRALTIKCRVDKLPLLDSVVLNKIMYANLRS